jgi:hypothetical protein
MHSTLPKETFAAKDVGSTDEYGVFSYLRELGVGQEGGGTLSATDLHSNVRTVQQVILL